MVKLYHLTDITQAQIALRVGTLESSADRFFRLALERSDSYARAEEIRETSYGKHKFKSFDEWLLNNHLQFQTDFQPDKYRFWHAKDASHDLVLFHFETAGYVGAQEFDFPGTNTRCTIRTTLSKDEPDETLAQWTHPTKVWIPTMNLEDCTGISAMYHVYGKVTTHKLDSENEYIAKLPLKLLKKEGNKLIEEVV